MANPIAFIKRSSNLVIAGALVLAGATPILLAGNASAGQLGSRSITMSTSRAGATDVEYVVQVTKNEATGAPHTIQGMVVEFCAGSPIIGDATCATPTGFDINEGGLAFTDNVSGAAFAIAGTQTDTNTLVLTRTDATTYASPTAITLTLGGAGGSDGVTNPSTANQTFFARVLLYTTAAGATSYTSGSPGSYIDAGGIALSTAAQIVVTAKVAERLTFCVYTLANCGAGGTAINLGDTNGILDPAGPFVDINTKFDISTNASGNAVVVLKGGTLTSGTPTITEIGGTAAASAAGTEQFGICLHQSAGAGLTVSAPYNNANCNSTTQTAGTAGTGGNGTAQFAFDTAATTAASGDVIATKPAGNSSTATIPMIGNVANATEAGIYTTTLTFVATGTY